MFTTNKAGEIVIESLRVGEYRVSEVLNEKSSAYVLPADKTADDFGERTHQLIPGVKFLVAVAVVVNVKFRAGQLVIREGSALTPPNLPPITP